MKVHIKRGEERIKIINWIIVFLTAIMLSILFNGKSFADDGWNGDGTENSPYRIENVEDLARLAEEVNKEQSERNDYEGKYFELVNDIDLKDYDNWTPIGRIINSGDQRQFKGNFNGNNKKISNLKIKDENLYHVGLFGDIKNSEIKNLHIASGQVEGKSCVGAIVGAMTDSSISNCSNSITIGGENEIGGIVGYILNSNVEYCKNRGKIKDGKGTGGIVGSFHRYSNVKNCCNLGEISSTNIEGYIGGIVGYGSVNSKIYNSFNIGNIDGEKYVGGIAGANQYIYNCYNIGEVKGEEQTGGILGFDQFIYSNNCYNIGEIKANKTVGGVFGYIGPLSRYSKFERCYFDKDRNGKGMGLADKGLEDTTIGLSIEEMLTHGKMDLEDDAIWSDIFAENEFAYLPQLKVFEESTNTEFKTLSKESVKIPREVKKVKVIVEDKVSYGTKLKDISVIVKDENDNILTGGKFNWDNPDTEVINTDKYLGTYSHESLLYKDNKIEVEINVKEKPGKPTGTIKEITLVGGKSTLTENIESQLMDFVQFRLSGKDRYSTSVAVSKEYDKSNVVLLASGEKYTDELTATVLANKLGAPIMLTRKDAIPAEVKAEINRLGATKVILIGGNASISEKVEKELANYTVERIGGPDRYDTAILVGNQVRALTASKTEAILVDGTNFPDAIAMTSMGVEQNMPILLTKPGQLPASTAKTIEDWKLTKVTIGGGSKSVSGEVEKEVRKYAEVNRIAGADRYETSVLVAEQVYVKPKHAVIASGEVFPDAIVGAPYAAKKSYPIVLSRGNNVPDVVMDYILGNR